MATQRNKSRQLDTPSNLKGDYGNIAFLLLLYVLQGIPIGLSSAVPLLLQNRKVSYSEQALFSFVTWPFSVKLLWAPIVDSIYWKSIGRRKSWLIPVQLALGIFMYLLSGKVTDLLTGDAVRGTNPDIYLLTVIFLMLNLLAATQDIAVDGWALTMLSRRNIGYASTCNTVGQTAGYFIGHVIFLALESKDFCNKYIRSDTEQSQNGIITLESFLYYNGIVFLVVTILVAILKKETQSPGKMDIEQGKLINNRRRRRASAVKQSDSSDNEQSDGCDDHENEKNLSVGETYSLLYKIMKLPSLQLLAVILLTCKIGFSAPEAVSGLKLVEAGVKKENLALLAVPMVPLQIILPWVISRMTCGHRQLDIMIKAYPYRLLFGLIFPLVVYVTPWFKLADGTFPISYYILLIVVYALHQVTVYCIFVTLMAFHAAISDPSIGGTYMTMLNTITNLGANWPSTISLWLVDKLTFKNCTTKDSICPSHQNATIGNSTISPIDDCKPTVSCETTIDGYYLECVICVVFGFLWLSWGSRKFRRMQSLPLSAWAVSTPTRG